MFADLALGQMFEALRQVAREVGGPVAVDFDVGALDLVEHRPNLWRAHGRVIEIIDELVKRFLEVDVVFPERVIGIDQKVLAGVSGPSSFNLRGEQERDLRDQVHFDRDAVPFRRREFPFQQGFFRATIEPRVHAF